MSSVIVHVVSEIRTSPMFPVTNLASSDSSHPGEERCRDNDGVTTPKHHAPMACFISNVHFRRLPGVVTAFAVALVAVALVVAFVVAFVIASFLIAFLITFLTTEG